MARNLPIWGRMVSLYPCLRTVFSAQGFCRILCEKQMIPGTTLEERQKIAAVAAGGVW